MPSITIHTDKLTAPSLNSATNPLPNLLRTPSGLAILEIQGTIHAPFPTSEETQVLHENQKTRATPVGRLEFPLYDPNLEVDDGKWMKKVYLYTGKHQRLTGEVKKLPKPLLVIGKRERSDDITSQGEMDAKLTDQTNEDLEILEVVRHKISFGSRPEPVGE